MNNIPSYMQDRKGKRYQVQVKLENASNFNFVIMDLDIPAGYANSTVLAEALFIDDLHVNAKQLKPGTLVCFLPPWLRRERNYRRLGLGTRMVDLLKAFAKTKGLKRVEGKLSPNDLREWPELPDWYRKQGFLVVKDADGTSKSVIFHLV